MLAGCELIKTRDSFLLPMVPQNEDGYEVGVIYMRKGLSEKMYAKFTFCYISISLVTELNVIQVNLKEKKYCVFFFFRIFGQKPR